jgi:predicted DNA binding protein
MAVVEDITDRKERERTLRQQRDELAMLNRVTDLVLAITQELVESSSRDRIEESVCVSLADSDLYDVAWIGEPRAGEPAVRVRTAAGSDVAGQVALDAEDPVGSAIQRAIDTGDLETISTEADSDLVRTAADGSSPGTVAAVPLSYRGTVYGVLVLATDREYSFRDRELSGLRTLGKTVGFAINAITNRKLLFADTVVDLTFDVGGTDLPLVPTTAALDCSVSLDGYVVATATDALNVYLAVDGVDAATFVERVTDEPAVLGARVVADEADHRRVEVTVDETSILRRFSHHEASLRAIELEGGHGSYVLEAPLSADVEAIVDLVRSADDGVAFVAKAERERHVTTAAETAAALQDRLTDRQYEVFKTAHLGGYFEWPRDSTIEELAENMGIAGSTFHHHLRHAQRKLARALFDRDEAGAAGS